MKVPGPKTLFSLQAPTQTRTATSGADYTFAEVTTFNGSLEPLTTAEINAFQREIEVYTHLSIIGYEEIGDSFATSLIPKNIVVVANADNQLASETFNIIGFEPQRYPGNKIATFEIMLRKVL